MRRQIDNWICKRRPCWKYKFMTHPVIIEVMLYYFSIAASQITTIQQLETTPIYYVSLHESGVQPGINWVLCSEFHKAAKCQPGLQSNLRFRVLFQTHWLLAEFSSLRSQDSGPQLLEATHHSLPCDPLQNMAVRFYMVNKRASSLSCFDTLSI